TAFLIPPVALLLGVLVRGEHVAGLSVLGGVVCRTDPRVAAKSRGLRLHHRAHRRSRVSWAGDRGSARLPVVPAGPRATPGEPRRRDTRALFPRSRTSCPQEKGSRRRDPAHRG